MIEDLLGIRDERIYFWSFLVVSDLNFRFGVRVFIGLFYLLNDFFLSLYLFLFLI